MASSIDPAPELAYVSHRSFPENSHSLAVTIPHASTNLEMQRWMHHTPPVRKST